MFQEADKHCMRHSISESVTIEATEDEVFRFINNPAECVKASPSQEFSNIQSNDDGSHEFDYKYNMTGVSLTGHCTTKEFHPENHILVYDYSGNIDAEMRLTVTDGDDGQVVFECETTYEVSESFFGKLVRTVIERYNTNELETFTQNVKEMVENDWIES